MPQALLIGVAFPRGAYSGGDLGIPEDLPSPSRLHAAFVGAAAGGPWAVADDRILTADPADTLAVRWLEEQEPLGVSAPVTDPTTYSARRYRLRAAPNHPNETSFEPFSALDGPVRYAWPAPDADVAERLQRLAAEITHVGRADSTAIVTVDLDEIDLDASGYLVAVRGRGPGRVLRVARPGRFEALAASHAAALRPGRHPTGSAGRQAADLTVESAGDAATALRRFAATGSDSIWPFAEVWRVPIDGPLPTWTRRIDRRVAFAVAVHRGIVAAIGDDVPAFVTGREGTAPLQGAGHLAIHPTVLDPAEPPVMLLGVPPALPEADRAMLLEVLDNRPSVRVGNRTVRLLPPHTGSALPFWRNASDAMDTEVPIVLDAPGPPRKGRWTLDDAVLCSLGYALRRVLEHEGVTWESGWRFRRTLVDLLRDRGADARATRVLTQASSYVHRAREGDLMVAVHATVTLGELAGGRGGLLALGRARHLGGGLLRPQEQMA